MELNYDIYTISNASGTGKSRNYVKLKQANSMTEKELQETIQSRCSLTKGDVAAVLAELHDIVVNELSMGRRLRIPGLGNFALSAKLNTPESKRQRMITGKEVRLRGIIFHPDIRIKKELIKQTSFVRTKRSSQSSKYTEEQMINNIAKLLQEERYITCSIMRRTFCLTQYMAQKWLRILVKKGVLEKEGCYRFPIYFLKEPEN